MKKYNDGGEIQKKIDRFTKLIEDPRSTQDEKERYKIAIEKFKAMLPKEEKKEEEKKEDKKEDKKPAEKKASKKSSEKKEEKKEEEKEKPAEKKKGVQVLSSKRVMIDGKEVDIDSPEFCTYLVSKWHERRAKAEENKTKKKKTKSVMAKVSEKIEQGITTAIKEGIKDQKDIIEKNPTVFIGKVQKLETATENFLKNLKDVLGDEYDAKEVTATTKAIHEMIAELKKKYSNK